MSLIITPNTTAAIQLLAAAFSAREGAVLISDSEHNSNRLPWLHQPRVELPWAPGTPFPIETYRAMLGRQRLKLVSLGVLSNVTGASIPVADVVAEAHRHGVPVHLDAAQAFGHRILDITEQEPDFVSCSLHKAYGPTGLGVLYVRRDRQDSLIPALLGGGMVDDHHEEHIVLTRGSPRYEPGLQNYAAISAVPECISFLEQLPQRALTSHFEKLNSQLQTRLERLPGVRLIGPKNASERHHILNYYVENVDAMRLAELLDMTTNIQVRSGRLCAHHFYHRYGIPASVRVSFGYHNTLQEVDRYGDAMEILLERYVRRG